MEIYKTIAVWENKIINLIQFWMLNFEVQATKYKSFSWSVTYFENLITKILINQLTENNSWKK